MGELILSNSTLKIFNEKFTKYLKNLLSKNLFNLYTNDVSTKDLKVLNV